jgi:hypothetical protein
VRWWMVAASLPWLACGFGGLDGLTGGATTDAGNDGGHNPSVDGSTSHNEPRTDGGADAAGPTYADIITSDHPIAYFPFDEPGGTKFVYEKISGKQASVAGGAPSFGEPGVAGTAFKSDGNVSLDFGQLLEFTGGHAFTFEAWIYPVVGSDSEFYEYFNKRSGTTNGIVVYVRNPQGHPPTAQLEDDYAGGGGRGADIELPKLDHFIHIVHVYTPGVGVRAWADGKPGNVGYDDNGGPTPNDTHVMIASGIRGTIDEMAIYDYALSDTQIASHFLAGKK